MYAATLQHFNDRKQESKTHNLQFIHLWLLKQSPGQQTKNDNNIVDPKQVLIMASLTDLALSLNCGAPKKSQCKSVVVFFKWGNTSIISLEHMQKSKIVVYSWSTGHNQQLYKVSINQIKTK